MTIDILFVRDCPNHAPTVRLVQDTLLSLGLSAQIVEFEISDEQQAKKFCFLGSPTIRIDGIDIEPAAQDAQSYGYTCRTYNDGLRLSGMPSQELIRQALVTRKAALRNHALKAMDRDISVLLVEADLGLQRTRQLLLSALPYPIVSVTSYVDVCKLAAEIPFCLVVIDLSPSEREAIKIAAHIRRTWATAEILLLGTPSGQFDDPLYDEAVNPCFNPEGVVQAATRILGNRASFVTRGDPRR